MEKGHSYSKLSLWVTYVACWRSSLGRFIVPAGIPGPYSSQPTQPAHEKKQQLWEEHCSSALVGTVILNSTIRGMTISAQQIWTRTKHSAFRKLPWACVSWWVNMPNRYWTHRTCWALSDPAKLALWRQYCVILKSFQVHFHPMKAVT